MSDTVTLAGLVATTPRHLVTTEGLSITSFRLASNQRRFDRSKEKWIDGDTNWYTVTAFRQLAMNAAGSIAKGDRVLIAGRLKIREWESGERSGTSVEIEADSLGHDLFWGTAAFTRTIRNGEEPDAKVSEEAAAWPSAESSAEAGAKTSAKTNEEPAAGELVAATAPF